MNALVSNPIVDEARAWLGTPYKHQGRDKRGVDGIGLIKCVFRLSLDVSPADYSPLLLSGEPFLDVLDKQLRPIPFRTATLGDVLCFRTGREPGHPVNHFGIVVRTDMMIHAFLGQSVRETRTDNAWWQRRLAYAYRF